jgi:retron-type reverse transcriptase
VETYTDLYTRLYSYDNLELAWRKARKGKTLKEYVIDFESDLENHLMHLKHELETLTYAPAPLKTFIVRDPKIRRISASHFRDRVVHHAVCNIIGPIFEKDFIYDSFANQKGKGAHLAIKRLESFIRKIYIEKMTSPRGRGGGQRILKATNTIGFVLKADIKHYFDTIDQKILLEIIEKKIKDTEVIWLIKRILENHKTQIVGKGMPLGNLTSQFFANVYLNELDHFVKHNLKAKYYLRYVDDFVLLHRDKKILEKWKEEINLFLKSNLKIELHPDKTKIFPVRKGLTMLGFRVFDHYRLLKKSNARRIWKRLEGLKKKYDKSGITAEKARQSLEGWLAYAKFANTYALRKRVSRRFEDLFGLQV